MASKTNTETTPTLMDSPATAALPDPVALANELLDMCEELEPDQQVRALYEAAQILQRSGSAHYPAVLDAYRKAASARPTQQAVISHAQALVGLEAEHARRAGKNA